MKKIALTVILLQFMISGAAFSSLPTIDLNKRAKCKAPITNIARPYQEITDYYYNYLFTFEEQTVSRFYSEKLSQDTYLYCVSFGENKKSFYPKRSGNYIKIAGRWGYHLFKNDSFTDMMMVLGEKENFDSICGENFRPYAATSSSVYSLVFYKEAIGSNILIKVTSDEELENTYYYANFIRTMNQISSAAGFLTTVSFSILKSTIKILLIQHYASNFVYVVNF